MATFPALEPATRAFTLGDYPQLRHVGVSGDEVRFKTGSDRISQRLTLGYQYLVESQAQLLIDHYRGQQGSLISFDLPSIVWAGFASAPISAIDYEWHYLRVFSVEVASPRRYNITIDLESVVI